MQTQMFDVTIQDPTGSEVEVRVYGENEVEITRQAVEPAKWRSILPMIQRTHGTWKVTGIEPVTDQELPARSGSGAT